MAGPRDAPDAGGSAGDDSAQTSFFQPSIIIPFLLVSLIWGGTWIIIRDQIASVPPGWSVTWRFCLASLAMFGLCMWRKIPLWLPWPGQKWALLLAASQFILNFNFVYRSELYITSGLVAAMFALLIIPNAIFGRIFLGQRIAPAFYPGSLLAIIGVVMLFYEEFAQASAMNPAQLWTGIGLTVGGILSASAANIIQGREGAKQWPILSVLAWAMLWGVAGNILWASLSFGPPQINMEIGYLTGIAYLGLAASAITFPLYYGLIRKIGAGRAAYSSVLVPITAMLLSTLFEGWQWSLISIAGAFIGLSGLLLAMRTRKARNPRIIA